MGKRLSILYMIIVHKGTHTTFLVQKFLLKRISVLNPEQWLIEEGISWKGILVIDNNRIKKLMEWKIADWIEIHGFNIPIMTLQNQNHFTEPMLIILTE